MRKKSITAEELDKIFDESEEDILPYLDLSKAERPGHTSRKIQVSLPDWLVSELDMEADRRGVSRQSLVKSWIAERLTTGRKATVR